MQPERAQRSAATASCCRRCSVDAARPSPLRSSLSMPTPCASRRRARRAACARRTRISPLRTRSSPKRRAAARCAPSRPGRRCPAPHRDAARGSRASGVAPPAKRVETSATSPGVRACGRAPTALARLRPAMSRTISLIGSSPMRRLLTDGLAVAEHGVAIGDARAPPRGSARCRGSHSPSASSALDRLEQALDVVAARLAVGSSRISSARLVLQPARARSPPAGDRRRQLGRPGAPA